MPDLTDLEITQACARAAGLTQLERNGFLQIAGSDAIYVISERDRRGYTEYRPLNNRAQAAHLAVALKISVRWTGCDWESSYAAGLSEDDREYSKDWNRAICLCAARVQLAREKGNA
jgi:hypothetical protein